MRSSICWSLTGLLLLLVSALPLPATPPGAASTPLGPVAFEPLPDSGGAPAPLPPDFWTRSEPGDPEAGDEDGPPAENESPVFELIEELDQGRLDPSRAADLRRRAAKLHEEWLRNETSLRSLLSRQEALDEEAQALWSALEEASGESGEEIGSEPKEGLGSPGGR